MNLNLNILRAEKAVFFEERLDFSNVKYDEVLLKTINYADIKVDAYLIDNIDVHVKFNIKYNIIYLDAYDLKELDLSFTIDESTIFTSDLQRSTDYDYDFFETDINIKEIIEALILVDIPLNYSEHKENFRDSFVEEEQLATPFADIFNKKN